MRVAIVKLSAMGDIIHAMVVLQFIKSAVPDIRIDWVTEEFFAPLLEYNPHIDNILTLNLKSLKKNPFQLFSEIRKVKAYADNRYDLVIDAQGLLKSAVVSRLLGNASGFDKNSVREKAAVWFYGSKCFDIPYEMNVIERNFRLMMQAIGIENDDIDLRKKEPFLFFDESDKKRTTSFISDKSKNIVHVLGSSWESKVYPVEKFIEVIEGLEGNHLLVWGSEKERERAEYIAQKTEAKVLPGLTLNELKGLIASADLVIGGDSGPTHMAWALNRPSVTLFGPTPSARNTFETQINKVIDCGKEIDPRHLDKHDMCIGQIAPENVVSLAKELL